MVSGYYICMLMGVQNLCMCSFSVSVPSITCADIDEPGSSADMRPTKKAKSDHNKKGNLDISLSLAPAFTLMHMCDMCVYDFRCH